MSKSEKKKADVAGPDEAAIAEADAAALADEAGAAAAAEVAEEAAAAADESAPTADPLAALAAEKEEFREKWLRAVAELDNVRKRSARELGQARKFAQADVLRGFLEVSDNFERALQSVPAESDTDAPASFREGVELIYQKVRGVLKEQGVEPMEALATAFDPNFHEAVGQLPREGVEPGIVIEVIQQGYHFGDLVLRPARVIVSA